MYFWDCRSRSTLILVLAHLLHQARLITASCSMPTSSADTTMTSSRTFFSSFAFSSFVFLSFVSASRRPWSSSCPSSFFPSRFCPVISAISASICSMRASISASGARCRSTPRGLWKDSSAMWNRRW